MAAIEIRPQAFFGNKNRAFWNLQSAGWAGALILRGVSGIANDQQLSFLVPVIISTITGYSLTLLMSAIYKNLIHKRPFVTWGTSIAVLSGGAALFAFIDAWVFLIQNPGTETGFGSLFLGSLYLDFTLLGAWSALYYAINYFLRVEEQNDQLVQLEAQATRAQLAMLRYQLNPHFLFNTLNSISTLVLLKQTESANAMLSRLSSFLRHSLVNEMASQVTLSEEVETLKLYLGIEKMRFEERLRSSFDIDPAVKDALLPSLLLQPLVENAVKYAVTPQEEGADITVSAVLDGDMVRITVADTGPGQSAPVAKNFQSTGVGLGNIQERLNQAYGEAHEFKIISGAQEGLTVVIALPFETRGELEQDESGDKIAPASIIHKKERQAEPGIGGKVGSSDGQGAGSVTNPPIAALQQKET